MMTRLFSVLAAAAAGCLLLAGCNVGMAPKPMDEDQLKAALEKLPPQDQINYVKSTPMPAAMKAKRIAEIEKKTGYKDKSASPIVNPGAPATPSGGQ